MTIDDVYVPIIGTAAIAVGGSLEFSCTNFGSRSNFCAHRKCAFKILPLMDFVNLFASGRKHSSFRSFPFANPQKFESRTLGSHKCFGNQRQTSSNFIPTEVRSALTCRWCRVFVCSPCSAGGSFAADNSTHGLRDRLRAHHAADDARSFPLSSHRCPQTPAGLDPTDG